MTKESLHGAGNPRDSVPGFDLRQILRAALSPHRAIVGAAIVFGFAASLAEGIGIGLFIPFFQSLGLDGGVASSENWFSETLGGLFVQISEEQRVVAVGLAILAAVLLKALLSFGNTVLFAKLGARIAHDYRKKIFENVLTADFRVLRRVGPGRILNALSEESWRTADAATTMLQGIITGFTLILYSLLLVLISWQMTIVVGLLLAVIAVAVRLVTSRAGSAGEELTRTNARVAGKMVDGVSGVDIIRGYGNEAYERKRFVALSEHLSQLSVRVSMISGGVYPIYEVLVATVLVVVLFTSVRSGEILAPALVFALLSYRLVPVARRLEQTRTDLEGLSGATREASYISQLSDDSCVHSGSRPFTDLREGIALRHLSFRYEPDTSAAVDEVSADIPSKGLTAIVGPSGSGKSTLAWLLLGFFRPTEGQILVDEVPLDDLELSEWRRRVAVVPQNAFLFNATVRENIVYGKLDATEEEVIAAAEKAGANDVIESLAQGYETRLGEEGIELSGGERQRICLARALIRNPEILILDEATNALDSISEARIQDVLDEQSSRCAVIVIAHRLATIERADQILVMDGGRLVEQGTLSDLLTQNGLFARLYRLQRFEEKDAKAPYLTDAETYE
jgi:subfamily B ATP-binding cassette protein MsbA